jgi:hypothetical protein
MYFGNSLKQQEVLWFTTRAGRLLVKMTTMEMIVQQAT